MVELQENPRVREFPLLRILGYCNHLGEFAKEKGPFCVEHGPVPSEAKKLESLVEELVDIPSHFPRGYFSPRALFTWQTLGVTIGLKRILVD